ncbi:MAG: Neopullulanase [Chroococcidiopsis cubana SAG 39.79]|uniref:Neopullulanase n=1 Tax=Chroococcidiopsis cubana SAG 39.79 TaxID=388085 RepID=A0AB37UQ87_9CYAN|nr:glycoside hydrolase family 13 protein [Chroococcidiopsis cubana]MDZ4873712.1 Neopullulanase [Chroococcidiopsis cubana SAG 39.79]PSB58184.1 alpha-amylase [Chroococcidiopsis cubana CCALA 043]RUT13608.1 neopullulanase [Chroococcidiopsis cubana SAG 39.79]
MEITTPDWVKHAVFYQIFPDRFAKSQQPRKRLLKNATWEEWEEMPTLQGYKGGDLWGVMEQLDYLQTLGINAIYFTPIFQSASNHRYHTHDYYRVDPMLGGDEAFQELLEACHSRDIKVVLDGVFNHASRGFFFFHDILENGPYSPWVDWFKIEKWPLCPYDGDRPANYEGWAGNRALPVFNHDNPEVREYIMEIAEYWLKFGIDGWRLDVPFEIRTPGFWQEFRDRVKAINPDAYIVGEVWEDSREWLDGTQFDGVMNYLFAAPTIAFTAGDRVDMTQVQDRSYYPYPPLFAAEYATKMQELLQLYPWEIQLTQLNLLASHDTARLISIAGGDRPSVELATLLLLTFPGAPSIYYGDEVGLPGKIDPDSRRGFPLEATWDREILEYHRQLIALRHAYPALRTGDYQVLHAQGLVYVFARTLGSEEIVVAVNTGTDSAQVSFDTNKLRSHPSKLLFGSAEIESIADGSQMNLNLPPRAGCILV